MFNPAGEEPLCVCACVETMSMYNGVMCSDDERDTFVSCREKSDSCDEQNGLTKEEQERKRNNEKEKERS